MSLRRSRKQEAAAADFPLKLQEKTKKKNGCILVQKRRTRGSIGKRRCFQRRWFPLGSGRSSTPAGILEPRLPGSASRRTSDCECSQMDESSNHLQSLFSYGGVRGGVGLHPAFSKHVLQALSHVMRVGGVEVVFPSDVPGYLRIVMLLHPHI